LIKQRDLNIKQIAIELSSETDYQSHLQQAKNQWLERAKRPEKIDS
jgi:hypothetical protein